jgi:homoserine dehydrogenase
VGAAVARTLIEKRDVYASQLGRPLVIDSILVKDLAKEREGLDSALLTTDASRFLSPDVDIVVEMLGVEEPSLGYMIAALEAGKAVVTANKEVMAKHGARLLAVAQAHNTELLFEASVGGGIPIIQPLRRDLAANSISAISAIINGTTNYILTAMSREGADFDEALGRAQGLGYAEPDPTNDVEGEDARYKLAILASLAFRTPIDRESIHREGITNLTARDFKYAAEFGYAIKLLALASAQDGGIQARVHPALLPADAPLAKVDGVLNAGQVEGDLVGRVNFQGPGAGFPTVSAVLGDVMEAAQGVISGGPVIRTMEQATLPILPIEDLTTRYYIRLTAKDRPGVLAQIAACLGEAKISIATVIQKESDPDSQTAELVIMTHEAQEAAMQGALRDVEALGVVQEIGTFLRVEEQ